MSNQIKKGDYFLVTSNKISNDGSYRRDLFLALSVDSDLVISTRYEIISSPQTTIIDLEKWNVEKPCECFVNTYLSKCNLGSNECRCSK